ncbi:PREDICTED: interleukin-12 subunit beta [Elephantulus edwardii]|uniref:interleukin-12 subunit beta n=1 Tax=Elephantulus edwardii TaxID=28737 RepID=UPI0003F09CB2|nr:PREDICTED: interleukin-12 subunit beta [Elephantulus edwardii]
MCHQRLVISCFALVLLASPLVAIWELKKDVYVVDLDWHPNASGEEVVLTCNTLEEDGITWTSDQSSEVLGSGKTLTIQVKEFSDAGRYTCQKGEKVLSHSLLLLHKREDGVWSTDILKEQKERKNKTFLKCEAKNYSGHFTCWWLTAISADLEFIVKSSRGSSDSQGVTCGPVTSSEEDTRDQSRYKKYAVKCQEESACPAAEESLPIEVVVEAIHKLKYEKYTNSFFIRDIIKPDPPKNLQLTRLTNSRHVEVSWEYPDTWSTPHSYFSLTFCLQVHGTNKRERKEKLCVDKTSAKITCHKNAEIQVQARDRYYSSSWSEWASTSCNSAWAGALGVWQLCSLCGRAPPRLCLSAERSRLWHGWRALLLNLSLYSFYQVLSPQPLAHLAPSLAMANLSTGASGDLNFLPVALGFGGKEGAGGGKEGQVLGTLVSSQLPPFHTQHAYIGKMEQR